jgi:hypothetical protein
LFPWYAIRRAAACQVSATCGSVPISARLAGQASTIVCYQIPFNGVNLELEVVFNKIS